MARFAVDPRLASLLGESYRSSEDAVKELVDNAWDADAQVVNIMLPGSMTSDPIIVDDDGYGMTPQEVQQEYLKVARDSPNRLPFEVPTPTNAMLFDGRLISSQVLGRILGRWIPILGEAALVKTVADIDQCVYQGASNPGQ